jgi:hypothetical protein
MSKIYNRYGLKTKKEYVLGRLNRARSLKTQFPDLEKDGSGKNVWYKKNGVLVRRES